MNTTCLEDVRLTFLGMAEYLILRTIHPKAKEVFIPPFLQPAFPYGNVLSLPDTEGFPCVVSGASFPLRLLGGEIC